MVFNATFNNISAISWRSVSLVEETRGHGENHRPVASADKINNIMLYIKKKIIRFRTIKPSDYWTFGLLDLRTIERSPRTIGPSNRHHFQWSSCCSIFSMVFYVVFCRALSLLLSFFFWVIVLSVHLRFTDSDFPFESSNNSSKRDILNDCFRELTLILCHKTDTIIKSELGLAMK